jgi:16S rRNA (cytosine967-C5)-methyltransferase
MHPSTATHAARIIAQVGPALPADAALRQFFAQSRRWTAEQKRAISRAVFAYYRWLKWLDPKQPMAQRAGHAVQLQNRFNENPASVKTEALAARAVPDWLKEEMDLPAAWLRHLQSEPALWLRARPGTRTELAEKLGVGRSPAGGQGDGPPDALRYTGTKDLFLTPQFQNGEFEIQDAGSQWVGNLCAPRAGESWWDVCAGEGGKSLHLADLLANKGVVWATDRSARRLQVVKRRAARAKLFNIRVALDETSAARPPMRPFDGILLDAPCSGVGTWQRNPHARWTTTPGDVRELSAIQQRLLANAAKALKPGGRLIYSVCTLTRSETTAVVEAFAAAHPGLQLQFAGTNGDPATMFAAVWRQG